MPFSLLYNENLIQFDMLWTNMVYILTSVSYNILVETLYENANQAIIITEGTALTQLDTY